MMCFSNSRITLPKSQAGEDQLQHDAAAQQTMAGIKLLCELKSFAKLQKQQSPFQAQAMCCRLCICAKGQGCEPQQD